jgi:hypothetical protein
MKDLNPSRTATVLRGTGLVLILIGALTFDEQATTTLHTLWLPLLMAAGAALALQNILAVVLAVTALTGIHADPDSPDWVMSRAYPALAVTGTAAIAVMLTIRFRRNVIATRDARQAARDARRKP